jgi:hypothetical protein
MVILGGGYAVPVLEPPGWLAGIDVVDLEIEKDRLGDALDGIRPLSAAS